MLKDIYNKKHKVREFVADSAKGLLLIWNSGKQLTLINFSLFFLQSVIPLLSLLALKHLIDLVIHNGNKWEQTGLTLGIFAGLQLLNVLVSQFSAYQLSVQQQVITDNIAGKVLNKAIELDLQYYENPSFYDELHMVQQQSLNKPAQIIAAYQGIIQSFITIVLFSGFMFLAHWSILVLIIVLGIPLAISKLLHGYQQFQLDKNCMPAQRKSIDLFHYLTNDGYAKEVRIFGYGQNFIGRFLGYRKYIFSRKKELHYKFMRQDIIIQFFEILVVTLIYCIIIASALGGLISMGGLVIYFQVFQRLQTAISGLFQSGINLFQHQLYLRQILNYLDAPIQLKTSGTIEPLAPLKTGIEVRNLSFSYPLTQVEVLKGIDMVFKPGQLTVIAGENGSGKTTLVKLLCRLYEVDKQSIYREGVDITSLDPIALRKNTTAIFQDFGKYYLTVEDNIALGNNPDSNKIEKAAQAAGLADKINTFPKGYHTHLGRTFKNGEQLSGGQWQKIALARGFYKDSDVLILDEPTSSMDPLAEHAFFKNLKQEIGNKIVILITHRLYNLKMADHIYVMEDGRVSEGGTFNELLQINGAFKNMYNKQAQ